MAGGCALYCLVMSVLGVIFLGVLGTALYYDYEYIKTEDREERAWGCWYGALVYVVTGIICAIYLCCINRKKKVDDTTSHQASEIQMSDIEKRANPTLDDDPTASLLEKKNT